MVSEEMLAGCWKTLGGGFLLIAMTMLHRMIHRTQSPWADLKLTFNAGKEAFWAMLDLSQGLMSQRQQKVAGLLAEHRESNWKTFVWLIVGSPLGALPSMVSALVCLHLGFYMPSDLTTVSGWAWDVSSLERF